MTNVDLPATNQAMAVDGEPEVSLSVVVPVYRSMDVLPELVAQVQAALAGSKYRDDFELVLVNDSSPDESWATIRRLAHDHAFVRGISLRKNVGQHNATMAGLCHARGGIIVIMDDDLQHPPSAILELARSIEAGNDVCYTRYRGRKHAAWKLWGSWLNDRAADLILKKPHGLYLSSFKAMNREIADAIIRYDGPFTYIDGLILATTDSITSIDIDHGARWAGEGNYNLRRSLSLWLRMATGSSVYLLRLATISGFALATLSLLVIAVVVIQKLTHPDISPGWASTIATILLIGGLQMIFLGLLGEYIGRIYIRVNRAAQFNVAQSTFKIDKDGADR
jgi:undecaprenyl-phosphate 4-deoxy-4-formamido-L-arabinose transferase